MLAERADISAFLRGPVMQFFFGQSYYEQHGRWLFGEGHTEQWDGMNSTPRPADQKALKLSLASCGWSPRKIPKGTGNATAEAASATPPEFSPGRRSKNCSPRA